MKSNSPPPIPEYAHSPYPTYTFILRENTPKTVQFTNTQNKYSLDSIWVYPCGGGQWVRCHISLAKDMGSITGQEGMIPHAHTVAKKKKKDM